MVQSVCLTSRGSGVRLPQLPPPERANQSKILKSSDFGIFCLWPGLQNGHNEWMFVSVNSQGTVSIRRALVRIGAAGAEVRPVDSIWGLHRARHSLRADHSWIIHLRQKSSCWRLQRESHCRQFFYKGAVFLCLPGRTCLLCRRQSPRSTSHL